MRKPDIVDVLRADRWLWCDANPPPTQKSVLIAVCGLDWPVVAMLASDLSYWLENTGERHRPQYVTHWMEMPPLPTTAHDAAPATKDACS